MRYTCWYTYILPGDGGGGACEVEGSVTSRTAVLRPPSIVSLLFSRPSRPADHGAGTDGCGMRLSAALGLCRNPGRVTNMFVLVRLASTYARSTHLLFLATPRDARHLASPVAIRWPSPLLPELTVSRGGSSLKPLTYHQSWPWGGNHSRSVTGSRASGVDASSLSHPQGSPLRISFDALAVATRLSKLWAVS